MAFLTFFSTPKPFTRPHIDLIQRNAIQSWLRAGEDVEVILIGEEEGLAEVAAESQMAGLLTTLPGFGPICTAELSGEIGNASRFAKESSLALYLGMAALDNSSGQYHGTKAPRQVNRRAKAAMMVAVDRHRKQVQASQRYYEKKLTLIELLETQVTPKEEEEKE